MVQLFSLKMFNVGCICKYMELMGHGCWHPIDQGFIEFWGYKEGSFKLVVERQRVENNCLTMGAIKEF